MSAESTVISTTLVVLTGVFGLLIGSFLNVVVYRVPAGVSIVRPRSACPQCGAAIRGRDNIPVLSWLILGGRCRDCGSPISARYPLVELATGAAFAGVAWWALAVTAEPVAFAVPVVLAVVAFLYLAAVSIVLALIDLDTHTLPNAIVLPSYVVGAVLLGLAGVLAGDLPALGRALIGAASLFVLYLVLAVVRPGGMGMGDVKLAGVLGLWLGFLGWGQLVVGAFAGFLLGGLFAIGLLVARRADRKSGIPFGPWMLAGAWVGIFFGGPLADAYLSLIGLT